MRTATHLQLFRFKCVTLVQQEYHNSISSSRGFCRFFERKCKKIKISRSEIVSQSQQVHPKYRKFVTSVLRFTVFRIVSSHLTCCILFFYTFSAMFSCIFMYVYSLICIFQSATDFCVRFSVPLPSRSPFLGCSRPLGCTSCNKKTAQAAFSGPSVLCRIPYIKRRAAPKSRPPTIQAML